MVKPLTMRWGGCLLGILALSGDPVGSQGLDPQTPETVVNCEILIAGGGLGGVAAAYDALRLGRQVCMTEITDWIGGQVSAQGVSALDERPLQRENDIFPSGYSEFRQRVIAAYDGNRNPGACWVSVLCFSPQVGHRVLREMLDPYVESGQLQLFTDTVIKDLDTSDNLITSVLAITHIPRRPELAGDQRGNLSEYFLDWYDPQPSEDWDKTLIRFEPAEERQGDGIPWMVIDATETGELLPLAEVPYRLGTDPATVWEPSGKPVQNEYCTQGFTYTFVMERTGTPALPRKPDFYDDEVHGRYYSYEQARFNFPMIFTYRRIQGRIFGTGPEAIEEGDLSMQNWTWGNDWRLSTSPEDNFIFTQGQLEASGQLDPGGWMGGLRPESLRLGEQHALGFFYWLVAGTTDFLLQQEDPDFQKDLYLRYGYVDGGDGPMGSASGLSKYPYIRESRRIIGDPSPAYPDGFAIYENDITTRDFDNQRGRPTVFYDSVGVGQYPIDFHECIEPDFSVPEWANKDAQAASYPYQIPLRALIPQRIDNLLAGNKNIAVTRIASGSYRVHPVEWAIGTAAAHTATYVLDTGILARDIPRFQLDEREHLDALRSQIHSLDNPTEFPGTTITATEWADFR